MGRVELTGYADRLSVAAGESIGFMVSTTSPRFSADLVRLIHGDASEHGPGSKEQVVHEALARDVPGRVQTSHVGSYGRVGSLPTRLESFALSAWVFPTTPRWGERQALLSRAGAGTAGVTLAIEEGEPVLAVQTGDGAEATVRAGVTMGNGRWWFLYAGLSPDGEARLVGRRLGWPAVEFDRRVSLDGVMPIEVGPDLLIGAGRVDRQAGVRHPFNGKISTPRHHLRSLDDEEIDRLADPEGSGLVAEGDLAGAWVLGADPASLRIPDISGRGADGELVNRPTVAVTDHRWDGELRWGDAPDRFEAVHFHVDDLGDSGWEKDLRWEVPDDLESGVYALKTRTEAAVDHIPFVVTPPAGEAAAAVGLLLPTFTYLAYANEHMLDASEASGEASVFGELKPDPRQREWNRNREFGLSLYDTHVDGSGNCYSTARRPILNLRPDYTFWATGQPLNLGSDLYMVDWLLEKGFAHDVFTDGDLHRQGDALLSRYRVIITGGHPEYWSEEMLDALERYLAEGGRLMYLGGNGFYWVTSLDPASAECIEVRRGHAGTRVWESATGEEYHGGTGELGGLWRYRGRDPNKLVGIGFASQGFSDRCPGYERNQDADHPVVARVFTGVAGSRFGEFGLLMNGAAGHEIDRADRSRGTPEHAVVLASSTGHDDTYQLAVEDVLMTSADSGGTVNPGVRSDMVFFETPEDGAVFSVGSINWRGSLSHDGYENDVSRITENVLRMFLEPGSFREQG